MYYNVYYLCVLYIIIITFQLPVSLNKIAHYDLRAELILWGPDICLQATTTRRSTTTKYIINTSNIIVILLLLL